MNDKDMISAMPAELDQQTAAVISAAVQGIVAPVLNQLAEILKNNTEAIQTLAQQEQIQSERLTALEKEIRLNTPITPAQGRYISAAIKKRAQEIAEKWRQPGNTQTKKLGIRIRKAVLSRYGIGSMSELPRCEYGTAMKQIELWNDLLTIRDVFRADARKADGVDKRESGLVDE